jgi:hypothetical protein
MLQRLATLAPLRCAGCGRFSTGDAGGWRGYRVDVWAGGDPPEVVFFCPICCEFEFDGW